MERKNIAQLHREYVKKTWESINYFTFYNRIKKNWVGFLDKKKLYKKRKRKVSLEDIKDAYIKHWWQAHKHLWITRQLVSYYMREIKKRGLDFNNKD